MQAFVRRSAVGIALFFLAVAASLAAQHDDHQMAPAVASSAAFSEGVVKKIDRAGGKLTLAHGPIANVGMPAMTMAFKVAKPKSLDGLKAGDKLRFRVEDRQGVLTVVRIEALK